VVGAAGFFGCGLASHCCFCPHLLAPYPGTPWLLGRVGLHVCAEDARALSLLVRSAGSILRSLGQATVLSFLHLRRRRLRGPTRRGAGWVGVGFGFGGRVGLRDMFGFSLCASGYTHLCWFRSHPEHGGSQGFILCCSSAGLLCRGRAQVCRLPPLWRPAPPLRVCTPLSLLLPCQSLCLDPRPVRGWYAFLLLPFLYCLISV
jgi:hypothetical protein